MTEQTKMTYTKTARGFSTITFKDYYGDTCSLQKSSLADADAIWLGIDDVKPMIMASTVRSDLTGWLDYPLPEGVELRGRMHLSKEQVQDLLPILQHFVNTSDVPETPEDIRQHTNTIPNGAPP